MQILEGSWTEIKTGEMMEIKKTPEQDGHYKFNFFHSRESYTVKMESIGKTGGIISGLDRYKNIDPDLPLHYVLENEVTLSINASDKTTLASFRHNPKE